MKKLMSVVAALAALGCMSCTKDGKLTISSITYNATDEWFAEAAFGMRDAAKELGVTFVETDSHYDVNVEKDLVREQIKKKANALVVCPLTTEESGTVLSEAKTLGIPVVTWNTVVTPAPTTQIIVDSTVLGSATGDYLIEYVKKHNISDLKAILVIDDSFSIGIERCDGFRDAIRPLVDNGVMTVLYETRGNLIEETKVNITKLLEERPDVNFIWCWHQMSLIGTIQTLKELGRADILVAGTDMSVDLANDMLGDDVNLIAVTTQQPYGMGYEAVVNAVRAARGEETDSTVIIPTLTYTKDEPAMLHEYVETHAKFVK